MRVKADTELPLAVAAKSLEPVTGQRHQVFNAGRSIEDFEPFFRLSREALKSRNPLSRRKDLRTLDPCNSGS
jgi:hypothetical protein